MLKQTIRNFIQRYGYDFVKIDNLNIARQYLRKSDDERFNYYETPIGNYFLPKHTSTDFVANTMKCGKVFDNHIIELAKQYVQKGTFILDVGANYGQMSILFSKFVNGDCTVYSFEAQQMVYDILVKNLAANSCDNIKLFYNAVYDKSDLTLLFPEADLVKFYSYGSYGIDPNAKTGTAVKSIAIDSIPFDKPISFMKVDIQGSDLFALRGAINTIKKHKMPIVFEYEEPFQQDFNTSFQDYVDFVQEIDYKFVKTIEQINFLIVPR
jgi:FkbM family methyltransferase